MCDCEENGDDDAVADIRPQTITIFSQCPRFDSSEKDTLERTDPDSGDFLPIDSDQSNSTGTVCDCTASSSTDLKSLGESTGTCKLVCPTECDYSDDAEEAGFELSAMSLEDDKSKVAAEKDSDIECTLAVIKPEAVFYRKEIERRMYTEGFEIYQTRWLQLSPEQASEFYNDRFGELCFPHLVAYISSGPIMVFVLAKQNAVEEWRMIIGPTTVMEARLYFPDSIRAMYGRRGESFKNAVHGSSSREQAEREIHFFFPDFITEPLLKDEIAEDFLWDAINPVLVQGLTLCCKSKPVDPVVWLAKWLLLNNPNKPKLPEDLILIKK